MNHPTTTNETWTAQNYTAQELAVVLIPVLLALLGSGLIFVYVISLQY